MGYISEKLLLVLLIYGLSLQLFADDKCSKGEVTKDLLEELIISVGNADIIALPVEELPAPHLSRLENAALMGDVLALSTLIQGEDVNDEDLFHSLYTAASVGRDRVVKILLERGISPYKSLASGYTPIHAAVMNGKVSTVKLLIEAEGDADIRGLLPSLRNIARYFRHCDVLEYLGYEDI